MICPLDRVTVRSCPRKQATGGQYNECLACAADLDERAAHVAHHRGLGHPPLSRDEAMELAIEQARAAMPGQRALAQ
jgi:hypothetical protein